MNAFSGKHPAEIITLGYDAANLLNSGETIVAVAFTMEVAQGTDPSPAAMLSGVAQIQGTDVLQRVIGGLDGVTYRVVALIDTSTSRKLAAIALLSVTDLSDP